MNSEYFSFRYHIWTYLIDMNQFKMLRKTIMAYRDVNKEQKIYKAVLNNTGLTLSE